MNRFLIFVSFSSVAALLIGACTFGQTPPPVVELPQGQPPATDVATLEPAATDAPAAVDLAGPLMEIGSRYTWFDGSVLVAVPGDTFLMGTKQFADSKEHEVSLSDYWIYSNEVTNQQFAICVEAGECQRPDKEANPDYADYRKVNLPVVGLPYAQAAAYCEFVHGRLPTEAEWEYAARGPDENIFPWGDESPSCDRLNHNFCTGKLVNVNSYAEGMSDLGLWDMSGNVREWVADWYAPEYDLSDSGSQDPLGPELGEKRSVRSSSYQDGGDYAYAAHRLSLKPDAFLADLGFRCVIEDPTYFAPYCQTLVLYGAGISGGPGPLPVFPIPSNCEQADPLPSPNYGQCADPDSYITLPDPIPAGYTVDIPASCVGGPPTYSCSGSGTICLEAPNAFDCDYDPPPGEVPSCPPGYDAPIDDGSGNITCHGQGPGTKCPPGFELDPLLNCCSAINPDPHEFGYCIGFDMVGSDCYYNPGDPIFPHDVCVDFVPQATETCGDQPCEGPGCGDCLPPQTWQCGQNPACRQSSTGGCQYPDICSCQ